MQNEYRKLFDGVHASQRLKAEVLNMKHTQEHPWKRRLPAAALVAAVLALALTGTALAAEHFGYLRFTPLNVAGETGYWIETTTPNISKEQLSEEFLARLEEKPYQAQVFPFTSLDELEAFIGLEIADNPRLELMEQELHDSKPFQPHDPIVQGNWLLDADCTEDGLLCSLHALSSYYEENFYVDVTAAALLKESDSDIDYAYKVGYGVTTETESVDTENYVTPNGIEVTIFTAETPMIGENGPCTIITYEANFTLNNFIFHLRTSVEETQSADRTLATLKEVLDAYE